jgi:type I restriction enzyme, S subunit
MSAVAWPTVPLADVLRRSESTIQLDPDTTYKEVTVRLNGKGIVERRKVQGLEIASDRRYRAKSGQFIISRIDARHGASGLVPDALDGAIVTNDFPLFDVAKDRLDPAFLGWMAKTVSFVDLCKRASEGTTNRVRLSEDRFKALEIRLPPLDEQRRIVARIEKLSAKLEEARELRHSAIEQLSALLVAHLGATFEKLAVHNPVRPLGELTSHIVDGPHQTPTYLPEASGVPFVTVKNMVTGRLSFEDLNYVSQEDHREFSRRCRAERGDVLYSKDGATRGRPCYVDTDEEFSFFVSVALIKPLRDRLDGRYLVHLLNSSWIKDRMIDKSRGDMIPHIVLREIRAFPVPLPALDEQRRIVAELDALRAKLDPVKALQLQTAEELEAMLPAILDKAFKGEL